MKLIDTFRAATFSPHKHLHAHGLCNAGDQLASKLKPILRDAVAFKLSDDIVEASCKLAIDHPDILSELSRRARLPYPIECGHKCWWKPEHWRGDAGLGFVRQEYSVETRP